MYKVARELIGQLAYKSIFQLDSLKESQKEEFGSEFILKFNEESLI
jgi:hypothetical protein